MDDLEIFKVPYREIKDIYPHLYDDIFREIDNKQMPSFVYIGFVNNDYVGFMSAYLHNSECVYLQYAGFNEKFRGYYAPKLFNEAIKFVHKEYKGIICRIENTNIRAIKVALNTGFIIIGIRLDGVLYVELIKERGDGR